MSQGNEYSRLFEKTIHPTIAHQYGKCLRITLISLYLSSILWAKGLDLLDSLDRLQPNLRYYYQQKNRLDKELNLALPDSQNVRMVGKWGRGPSSRVTGRDNLVFLSLGSEVAIVDFSDSNPQIIYEVQARGLVAKSVLKDSFLFIGGPGIEIWNISNPSSPVFRNRIITNVSDLCIKDTLLYAIAGDSFRIFNIANIDNPYRVGASNDVGYYLSVSGNYAYVSDRWGLYIINIQNPANPYRVNSWGSALLSAQTRDTFCYVSTYDPMNPDWLRFTILNVANPSSIQEKSHIDYAGGNDVYLLSYFAYVSGYYLPVGEFQIIDISNPILPSVVSRCTTAGWNNGVWANNPFGKAFVADDWEGLQVINISNPTSPYIDTTILGAEYSLDVWVDNNYAYVANRRSGLKIIDISNPAIPFQVGEYDTIGDRYDMYSAVARDSFAYIGAPIPLVKFGVLDVSNPFQPILMGTTSIFNGAEDMVIRDSFIFVTESYKFEIFNVANPQQPRLAGRCDLPDDAYGMCLKDTFAYIANQYAGLNIINVAQPNNPYIVGTFPMSGWTNGVFVKDTIAYVASLDIGLRIVNVKNPLSPFEISSVPTGQTYDVVVKDSFAYVGCFTLKVINVSDPLNPFEVGHYTTPNRVRRTYVDTNYIYCACFAAGMCIFENMLTGIKEEESSKILPIFSILPNPVFDRVVIRLNNQQGGRYEVCIHDALGKLVVSRNLRLNKSSEEGLINLSNLSDGVYFITIRQGIQKYISKIVKLR